MVYSRTVITFIEDCFSATAINLLPSNQEAGGVGEVDVSCFSVVVQRSWVHQVLYGNHVFAAGLHTQAQSTDNPWSSFAVEQEEVVLGSYEHTEIQWHNFHHVLLSSSTAILRWTFFWDPHPLPGRANAVAIMDCSNHSHFAIPGQKLAWWKAFMHQVLARLFPLIGTLLTADNRLI